MYLGVLVGIYVGIVPVYLGFFSLPFLKKLPGKWLNFLITLTVGILIFLLFDVAAETFELATALPARMAVPADGQAVIPGFDLALYNAFGPESGLWLGPLFMLVGFSAGMLGLVLIGNLFQRSNSKKEKRGKEEDETDEEEQRPAVGPLSWLNLKNPHFQLAFMVALGIGLHNLGEGLAVGASFASRNIALANVLIFGFAIHNTTEGLAIVAPVSQKRIAWQKLAFWGMLAGAPTILGALLGLFFFSNALAILFFAIAAGAILYVVVEIIAQMGKDMSHNKLNYLGVIVGFSVMYLTSLLIIA